MRTLYNSLERVCKLKSFGLQKLFKMEYWKIGRTTGNDRLENNKGKCYKQNGGSGNK
jgi:hypothetical protein